MLEGLDGPPGGALGMVAVVVVGSKFVVRRMAGEHVISGDEEAVGDGNDRLLVSATPQDTAIPGGDRAVTQCGRGCGARSMMIR